MLNRWQENLRLGRDLADRIIAADRSAGLTHVQRDVSTVGEPFLSRALEHAVFAQICARLARKTGAELLDALSAVLPDAERRARGFWSRVGGLVVANQQIAWQQLVVYARIAGQLRGMRTELAWTNPDDAVNWYRSDGWQLDAIGDELLRRDTVVSPELVPVLSGLRQLYRTRWERSLIRWSDLWTDAGCPVPQCTTAGEWLTTQLATRQPMAVLLIDALRYDLGAKLVAQINQQEATERAQLHAARAPLPSITALGMAAALPLPEAQLRADLVQGDWRVYDDTRRHIDLSSADGRRAWLRERFNLGDTALRTLADLAQEIPTPADGHHLFIFDTAIDRLGHDDELQRSGTEQLLQRYADLIMRLRDTGWRRVAVVTDHGFIQWDGHDEQRQPVKTAGHAYKSRRALAYPATTPLREAHSTTPGGAWKIVAARGAGCYSAYGGLGYFHGGAALQEWIIPCVLVTWPATGRQVHVTLEPLAAILSQRPRVVLRVVRDTMFVEDALPARVDVVIRNADTQVVVFRSKTHEVKPDTDLVPITVDWTEVETPRGTPLRIEAREAATGRVIDTHMTTLKIDLSI